MIHSPDYVFTVLVSIFISKFHSHLEYCMHIANIHTMYAHVYVQMDKPTPPAPCLRTLVSTHKRISLLDCRTLWGGPQRDTCSQYNALIHYAQWLSNAWISDCSYNTGTELTGWSRHTHIICQIHTHILHSDPAHHVVSRRGSCIHGQLWQFLSQPVSQGIPFSMKSLAVGLSLPFGICS